uniref:Peptidoglycan glycosyltransferase n=1 Tax=Chlorobium chlorochromatii (strain CaD3) TaxID=340177 RepID=Q3ARE9_CHLCH
MQGIKALVIAVFALLFVRLLYLQVINFQEPGSVSASNSVRRIWIHSPRGRMIDRNGSILVDNQPLYSVRIIPAEFNEAKLGYLAWLLELPKEEVAAALAKGRSYSRFAAATITRNVNEITIARLSENLWQLPGVIVTADNKRLYSDSLRGAHLFGYLRSIPKEKMEELSEKGYSQDDKIGFSGLEKIYEERLKGQKGARYEMVTPLGKYAGKYDKGNSDIAAVRGDDLYLSIDGGLQMLAEKLLTRTGKSGAVVALDPNDGGVLALASAPDYSLNTFNGFTDPKGWREIITSPQKPLFNRTVQAVYPPGSVYKMVLAMAGMEEKLVDPERHIYDGGVFIYGGRRFLSHGGRGHGSVNMRNAIAVSSNVYFYTIIFNVGFENWTKYGDMFGFGRKTDIDLPGERKGLLPSAEYYDKRYGKKGWTKGYLVSLSIGQGELGTTPVQLAAYTAAIANKGTLFQPHIVNGYRDTQTGRYIPVPYQQTKLPISPETFALMHDGMRGVVLQGTGTLANVPGVAVAGKTGTAQNTHGKDHAWFIAFAPVEQPKIALAVLVENAGFGGSISAPIARELIHYYINLRNRRPTATRGDVKVNISNDAAADSSSAAASTNGEPQDEPSPNSEIDKDKGNSTSPSVQKSANDTQSESLPE